VKARHSQFVFFLSQLPGNPTWFGDGSALPPRDLSALGRLRIYARPADVEAPTVQIVEPVAGATFGPIG